ncbi:uncharacterized protein [Miscanthus floridulus]|uniref:uncharacterized protein n=1 Tax=Miscanthus floridulus TaxID=154761 RepID=UPI0034598115
MGLAVDLDGINRTLVNTSRLAIRPQWYQHFGKGLIDLSDIDLTLTNTLSMPRPHIWVEDPHPPSAPSAPSTSPSPHLSASTSTLTLLGYLRNKGPPLTSASTTFNDDFNFAPPSPSTKVKNLPQSSSSTPSTRSPHLLIRTSQEGLRGCIRGPIQPRVHVLPAAHEPEEASPAGYDNYSIQWCLQQGSENNLRGYYVCKFLMEYSRKTSEEILELTSKSEEEPTRAALYSAAAAAALLRRRNSSRRVPLLSTPDAGPCARRVAGSAPSRQLRRRRRRYATCCRAQCRAAEGFCFNVYSTLMAPASEVPIPSERLSSQDCVDTRPGASITNFHNEDKGFMVLDDDVFDVPIRKDIVHRVVWLAARQQGTHSTKIISEVSGTGRKPYKQKRTRRAWHGTLHSPQFHGGATIHGSKPRSHAIKLQKKVRRLWLKIALSAQTAEGKIFANY